ncbi:MAG: M24 family metallopeptidase [Candidatus Hermodarchaeia archaeon]|jgi:Xaa-Pro aminopeptidase
MPLKRAPESEGYELYGPKPHLPDIPYSEWKSRIDKVKGLMQEENIDLLMLWNENNIRYFTAFTSVHWNMTSIVPLVALIPRDTSPVVITSEFFRWTVEAQSWVRDIRCTHGACEHSEKTIRQFPIEVATEIREMGYEKANIALEMGQIGDMFIPRPLNDILNLMNALPEANFVDGDHVIWRCRQIKSPLEIERLIKAAAIHREATTAVVNEFRSGMTEADVGKIFICNAYQNDAEQVVSGNIMCGAAKEGIYDTKHAFDGVTISKDDYLEIDMFLSYKGYWADMARVINVGPVTDEFRKYSDQLRRSFEAVVQAAKPGVPIKEIQKVSYESGGSDTYDEFAGHGIGLDIHEPPVLCLHTDEVLQAGMTLEIEPFFFRGLRSQGGQGLFHYENLIIITEDGCTPIYGLPKEIIQVTNPIE